MARIIFPLNRPLTNAQIAAVYGLAEKFGPGISLYGNTPSPTRDSFTWMIEGGILRVVRFTRHLKAMR
ncbi:hypothetical protein ACFVYV_44735 [Streptomyces mirabilis]|jgi:hypothetical protein|uniref:hypothetical protein n=1 Tax=Streptomyces TaxID=1883 RepID=UPI000BD24ADD|nr:hypothetical protein [Streptomyces sp. OV198]SOE79809.1 hypothetical protein SAMN05446589_8879 [Streptomyces sp. OV198]